MIEVWVNATFENKIEDLEKALEAKFEEPAVVLGKDVQYIQVWGVGDHRGLQIVRFTEKFLKP